MAVDFYEYLRDNAIMLNMPPVEIQIRETDKYVIYNKDLKRLDFWAGEVYQDEVYWRLIMWANPEYDLEFDIPNNTVIRIAFPIDAVIQEVVGKIENRKNNY